MRKLILALLFIPLFAFALTDIDRQEILHKNILGSYNPGFENGKASWTIGTDTITPVSSGSNLLTGKGSITWNSAGAGRILASKAVTIPKGMYASNGYAQCKIQTPSGTATHTISVYDGSGTLASSTVVSSTTPVFSGVNFIFPSSGTVQLRITSVAADEPLIAIDDCYIGGAFNIAPVSQASLVGMAKIPVTSGCYYTRTNTAFGALTEGAACPGPTVISNTGPGTIQTTDNAAPKFTVNGLPPGQYLVTMAVHAYDTTSAGNFAILINDGTTSGPQSGMTAPAANRGGWLVAKAVFTYTTTANRNFELFTAADSGTVQFDLSTINGGPDLTFLIERFPTSAETGFSPTLYNWHLDLTVYNVANANYFDLGSSDISTYTAPNLTDLSMVLNPGSLPAKISCSSTNPPTGLTCGAGNEEAGFNFDLPAAGDVEICGQFDHYTDTTNGFIKVNFAWQETTSTSQTSIQDCGPATVSGIDSQTQGTHHPTNVCGICHFTSSGNKTVRLMRKQVHSNVVSVNAIHVIDQGAGQQQLRIIARPLTQNVPSPILVNSIVTPNTQPVIIASARITGGSETSICSSSPCTIYRQMGSWIDSVTRSGTGTYTVNFKAGTFTDTPDCYTSTQFQGSNAYAFIRPTSSTAAVVLSYNFAGNTSTDAEFSIMCMRSN